MLRPDTRVGVAVSGGPDSVALLAVLRELAGSRRWDLTVLHLDHGLRGAESDADAEFVADLGRRWQLTVDVERIPAGALQGNLEQAARHARLRFYARARRRLGLDRVATGHTRSDQAETVLFRLMRGAGTSGLAGILPVTESGLVRPLLEVSRPDVLAFLRERGIGWREDGSNQDPRFRRNRIRHELLPAMARDFNPAVEEALAQTAGIAADEVQYWRAVTDPLLGRAGAGWLIRADAANQPLAARRQLVREAFRRTLGWVRQVEFAHVESVAEMVGGGECAGGLPGGLRAIHVGGQVWIGPEPLPYGVKLQAPGAVAIPGGRLVLERAQSSYNTDDRSSHFEPVDVAPDGGFSVRSWTPGDAYQPAGQRRARKLTGLFQEAHIPLWDRWVWPIIVKDDRIVWTKQFGAADGWSRGAASKWRVRVENLAENESPGPEFPSE